MTTPDPALVAECAALIDPFLLPTQVSAEDIADAVIRRVRPAILEEAARHCDRALGALYALRGNISAHWSDEDNGREIAWTNAAESIRALAKDDA
jgi:hypothetical protein